MANSKAATKRHRSFTSSNEDVTKLEPVTFDLHDEEFTAVAQLQGAILLEFIQKTENGGVATLSSLLTFIESALGEEEYKKFDKLIHDPNPEKNTDITVIAKIVEFLVEEYTARPTQAS